MKSSFYFKCDKFGHMSKAQFDAGWKDLQGKSKFNLPGTTPPDQSDAICAFLGAVAEDLPLEQEPAEESGSDEDKKPKVKTVYDYNMFMQVMFFYSSASKEDKFNCISQFYFDTHDDVDCAKVTRDECAAFFKQLFTCLAEVSHYMGKSTDEKCEHFETDMEKDVARVCTGEKFETLMKATGFKVQEEEQRVFDANGLRAERLQMNFAKSDTVFQRLANEGAFGVFHITIRRY